MAKQLRETLPDVWKALINSIKTAHQLAPCLVILMIAVVIGVTVVAITSAKLMVGTVLLLVLTVTVIVYATTGQFGEATLALVAGILTAYSVTWTPARFVAFIAVWLAFSTISLMIASIKLSARSESLYRQASIALAESRDESPEIEKQLRTIGDDRAIQGIGPIERAESLLLFSYRKLPIEIMPIALKAVAMLSVITDIESKRIGVFIADVFKVFDFIAPEQRHKIIDIVYEAMERSSVPPIDFISGFENSRRFVLSRSIGPVDFFSELRHALESGVAPDDCGQFLSLDLTRTTN